MLRRVLLIIGGLFLLVVAALGITVALLDIDGLIAKYKPKALAAASEAVGREVEAGTIETTWFPDLGIVANDLVVASSTVSKSEAPMVEVKSLRLSVAIWDALFSLGQKVDFDEIVLVQPVVRVRQRPDGTWNFASLGPDAPAAEPEPEAQMTETDRKGFVDYLEATTIDRIAIEDGVIMYADLEREVELRDLDLEIRDVALGQPLNARLAVAVAAEEQNLLIEAATAPLPETLLGFTPPAVESVRLKTTRLPVARFVPDVEGYDLKRLALDIDLEAKPTNDAITLAGRVAAGPIRWVEGGETGPDFTVATDLDARYAVESGQAALSGTKIELGPLVLSVTGEAETQPAVTGQAKIETTRAVRLPELAPLAPGLDALPPAALTVALDASVGPEAATLNSLVVGFANATLKGRARYPLGEQGRLTASFSTGEVDLAKLLQNLQIDGAALPAESRLTIEGEYGAGVTSPASGRLNLSKVSFVAGKSRFDATGAVTSFSPVVATLDGRSPYLNIDQLLPPPTEDEAPPPDSSEGSGLEGITVTADLQVDQVVYSGVTARDARAKIVLENEQVELKQLRFDVFGGRFSAAGTTLNLARDPIAYHVAAQLQALQASQVMGFMSETLGETLSGQLSTDINLDGAGFDVASMAQTLSGSFAMALSNGELNGVDLIGSAAQPVAKALKAAKVKPSKAVTSFRELAATFTVEEGRFVSTKPVRFDTPGGDVTLNGSVGLDQTLSLSGQVELPPQLIRSLTGGRVRPRRPLPVGLELGCELKSPCVQGVDADAAVASLAKAAAGELVSEAKERIEDRTGVDVDQLEEKAKQAESEAKKAAEDAADKAKKKAKEKAKDKLKSIFGR